MQGSFQIPAKLAASNSYPWLAAPSPYIVTAQCGFFMYFNANANPVPTGI